MDTALPSKRRVNRAGERLREFWDGEPVEDDELTTEIKVVLAWRAQFAGPIGLTMPGLRNWVGRYSSMSITPVQRMKRLPRIVEKLSRHPGMQLARMQDIGGARAVLRNREEVDRVYGRITRKWKVDRVSDWRQEGRPDSGYRALHVMVAKHDTISDQDRVVEIQLRTEQQQRWAEVVSQTEDRLGFALRDGDGPTELVDYFRMASDVLAAGDGDIPPLTVDFARRFDERRRQVARYFG
ncbi:MAG TPA: RelA/SpoT domain-containing protein [Solirubrobacterales bacterium]|nr:RelA/SpoT domain-containing protein [Solirubrobacterales bacterium]